MRFSKASNGGEREEVNACTLKYVILCQVFTAKLILRASQPTHGVFFIKANAFKLYFYGDSKGN